MKQNKLLIAILASSLSASVIANEELAKLGINEELIMKEMGYTSAPPPPSSKKPVINPAIIETDPSGSVALENNKNLSVNLSPADIELINLKRDSLIKYLYEQERLKDVRNQMKADSRSEAIKESMSEQYPLSPEEIIQFRKMQKEINKAQNTPINNGVKTSIRTVDLDIGSAEAITLSVASGFASSMVFYDESGNPWPVQGEIIGNDLAFKSEIVGEQKHIAIFEILQDFAESNALINLQGLPIPLVIRLKGTDSTVDSRLSVRIPRIGPNTEVGEIYMPEGVDNAPDEILEMLNGGELLSGEEYELNGVSGTVYFSEGSLYIRSKAKLLSPPINPPLSMEMQSPTGYNVYKIPPVTQLLFSQNGELKEAEVKEKMKIDLPEKRNIFNKGGW